MRGKKKDRRKKLTLIYRGRPFQQKRRGERREGREERGEKRGEGVGENQKKELVERTLLCKGMAMSGLQSP